MKTMQDWYGMAMFSYPFYDQTGYGHSGEIDGFQSQAAYYPEGRVAVSYTANGVNISLNDMMTGVLSIFFNRPYIIPDFAAKKTDNPGQHPGE